MAVRTGTKRIRRLLVEQRAKREAREERHTLSFAMACWIGGVFALVYAVSALCYAMGQLTIWMLGL